MFFLNTGYLIFVSVNDIPIIPFNFIVMTTSLQVYSTFDVPLFSGKTRTYNTHVYIYNIYTMYTHKTF